MRSDIVIFGHFNRSFLLFLLLYGLQATYSSMVLKVGVRAHLYTPTLPESGGQDSRTPTGSPRMLPSHFLLWPSFTRGDEIFRVHRGL